MIFTLYVIKNIIDFDTNIIEKNVENKKVLNKGNKLTKNYIRLNEEIHVTLLQYPLIYYSLF